MPFPAPGDLPNIGIEPKPPATPALAGGFFTTKPSGKQEPVELTHNNGTDEGYIGMDEVKGLNMMWVLACLLIAHIFPLIEEGRSSEKQKYRGESFRY